MSGIVAIVGRPNVGKSTFFNRLVGHRVAIENEQSGVTRDRHYGKCIWNGVEFSVIDTGGYVIGSEDIFEEAIRKQVLIALNEADLVIFMLDTQSGVTDLDHAVAEVLRQHPNKKIIAVANKADNNDLILQSYDCYTLGFEKIYPVCSLSGSGTGDLLDDVVDSLPKDVQEEEDINIPRIAIVGRPNVGKSSLVNLLLEDERSIVTDIPGTTRDSIHTRFNKYGHDFMLVDTAGLRRKAKVHDDIEFYSVMRTIRAIEDSDVCVLMLDASVGIEAQDLSIMNVILKNRKGLVVLVNKWDLVEKERNIATEYENNIKRRTAPFTDYPLHFVSALTKQRVLKSFDSVLEVYENRKQKIATSKLNEIMLPEIEAIPPPAYKGKYVKIKYITQLPTSTPQIAFYCNLPQYVKEPYKRFLENKLRHYYNFSGVPLEVHIRKK
ncbi:MAG: ribosome biogenesis GTPase Der [Salinivirgaceae bacterium]|nr:ribosome biogenesis GTPase Der [Salinivirgaceae bacterium]MDY0280781.1 ribosome biogenesis GTPase Der [Salinivirgaceae bacterium]